MTSCRVKDTVAVNSCEYTRYTPLNTPLKYIVAVDPPALNWDQVGSAEWLGQGDDFSKLDTSDAVDSSSCYKWSAAAFDTEYRNLFGP